MPSAVIHDAQVLARHMPAAMLFVPIIDGIGHAFGKIRAKRTSCSVVGSSPPRLRTCCSSEPRAVIRARPGGSRPRGSMHPRGGGRGGDETLAGP